MVGRYRGLFPIHIGKVCDGKTIDQAAQSPWYFRLSEVLGRLLILSTSIASSISFPSANHATSLSFSITPPSVRSPLPLLDLLPEFLHIRRGSHFWPGDTLCFSVGGFPGLDTVRV